MKKTLLFIFILAFTHYGICQKNTDDRFWINAGIGASFSQITSSGLIFSYQHKILTVSTRFVNLSKGCVFCSDSEYTRDYGVLFGLIHRRENGFISAGTGFAMMDFREGKNMLNYNIMKEDSRHSIPIEVQAFITRDNGGLGLYGFANLNTYKSYAGVMICIQLSFSA